MIQALLRLNHINQVDLAIWFLKFSNFKWNVILKHVKSLFQNIYGAIASMFRKSRWRRPTHCLVSCPACFSAFASAVDPNLLTLIQRRDIYAQKKFNFAQYLGYMHYMKNYVKMTKMLH